MATNFDERAKTWDDDPKKVRRAEVVADAVRDAVPLRADTRLLEYGAGTGLVSQALARDVGGITLAEPSSGMREVMTGKVASGTLPGNARIWDLDLASDAVPDERFDVIVSVMTLHHIVDLPPVLRGLATLLDDDGRLCVVDLEQEDGSFHRDSADFEGHDGFAHEDLRALLEDAGFADVRFSPCHEMEKNGRTFPLFLATARRA